MFQTLIPPADMNWPMATSRKNIGIPARITIRKYGSRKAPGQTDRHKLTQRLRLC